MKAYEHENITFLSIYRFHESARRRLILEWKNPLLKMKTEEFAKAKYDLAFAIKTRPGEAELRIKWELLREVELG